MKEIAAEKLPFAPFDQIGKGWMLVSAGSPEKCSTMTASWGGLGVMWGKNVAAIVIRPQRHTLTFLEKADHWTLSFFDEKYRPALNYCGSHSGGENEKIAAAGLTLVPGTKVPVFQQAKLTLVCRKLYRQPMDPHGLVDSSLDTRWYPNKDYHILFVGEIEKALQP
ncbi:MULTISPECIES: flavin reductase [Caproicibacterium]|jgi:flavin reductase (DIM6/NTAB) family NADH-FMN oxidoreductase RutF|uniref:Flavin reductase family protein n=1 Tax=Caproicibacterium lactatifermentans TaxID=2666138 RepID=A0A859DT01_9FIRM|nr:flavin reductase [Caproicibacterium lactatifermentans]ARP49544.1 flavin reductase [Ruminococcaceae bacterium CPB6]MDD4807848.1 flavin reductase [Oscillospiraceae bacterium]QKN23131.1 flavin reductase family protein [Caproicibacterium lactatifermentans]